MKIPSRLEPWSQDAPFEEWSEPICGSRRRTTGGAFAGFSLYREIGAPTDAIPVSRPEDVSSNRTLCNERAESDSFSLFFSRSFEEPLISESRKPQLRRLIYSPTRRGCVFVFFRDFFLLPLVGSRTQTAFLHVSLALSLSLSRPLPQKPEPQS